MAKKNNVQDSNVLPAGFLGDVVEAKSQPIVSYEYKYGDRSVEIKCKTSLSHYERQQFVEAVWGTYYAANKDGEYDYRPYVKDLVIRLMTVVFYCVNVHLDIDKEISAYEKFLIDTDFYDCLCEHLLDYHSLLASVDEYINLRINAQNNLVRNRINIMVEALLGELSSLLNKINADIGDLSPNDIKLAVDSVKDLVEQKGDDIAEE